MDSSVYMRILQLIICLAGSRAAHTEGRNRQLAVLCSALFLYGSHDGLCTASRRTQFHGVQSATEAASCKCCGLPANRINTMLTFTDMSRYVAKIPRKDAISSAGCTALKHALKHNDGLTELDLTGCNIVNAEELAEILRTTCNLKR
jgi:hypothetical protein